METVMFVIFAFQHSKNENAGRSKQSFCMQCFLAVALLRTLLILQPLSYLRALQIRLGARSFLSFQHPLESVCTQVWSRWDQTSSPYLQHHIQQHAIIGNTASLIF